MSGLKREDSMMTYRDVAAALGVPVGTVYSWVHTGAIPHVRLGPRLVRFSRASIEGWLAARSVPAKSEAC
jgi:excisionase family DNA binding protein